MKQVVTPKIWHNTGVIELREEILLSPLVSQIVTHMLDTKEAAVRAALIELGWTPPADAPTVPRSPNPVPPVAIIDRTLMQNLGVVRQIARDADGHVWHGLEARDSFDGKVTHWMQGDPRR